MACQASSWLSYTLAGPLNLHAAGSTALNLTMALSVPMLPWSTANPPWGWTGSAAGRITAWSTSSTVAALSPRVPNMPLVPASSRPPAMSSFTTPGRPPAASNSSMV